MKSSPRVTFLLILGCCVINVSAQPLEDEDTKVVSPLYGVDVSFPMTRPRVTEDSSVLLGIGRRQAVYDELLEGCSQAYDRERCMESERDRIERNARRPALLYNFTTKGYAKIKAPAALWNLVENFWEMNGATPVDDPSNNPNWVLENWEYGESTVNHWEAPSYFISLHNNSLVGGGLHLEDAIWDATKSTLEAWTGQRLKGCSLYGVRIYTSNSILHTHVDRVPLISSAILNVAQDTDEPWPLEVIGHDGLAHNITMEPGDLVLYESHSILHGRPFALQGRYMANLFVHFEVISEDEYNNNSNNKNDRLPYVNYDRVTAKDYQKIRKEYDDHWSTRRKQVVDVKDTHPHYLAGNGKLSELQKLVEQMGTSIIHAKDAEGWQPLHEAARNGHIPTIHYLLEQGADINAMTHTGANAMYIAEQNQGANSLMVKFLQSKGGILRAPIPPTLPHQLAGDGDLVSLQQLAEMAHPRLLHGEDENRWTPLHEAARGGHVHVVEYLLREGALLNAQTAKGGTPLYYAEQYNGVDSLVYQLLKDMGGIQLGPEL